MESASPSYKGHRYPVEVIAHCVWLYFRFPLSYREVEELMLQRGVIISYETVRRWCVKFGQAYAAGLRRRRPQPGDKWHLDEVFVKIGGERQYLWSRRPEWPRPRHPWPRWHLLTATQYRFEMALRFTLWDHITGAAGRPAAL